MRSTDVDAPELDNSDVRHEYSDVPVRAILGFGLGLVVVSALISFLLWLLFGYFDAEAKREDPRPRPLARQAPSPPPPRLQALTPPEGRGFDAAPHDELIRFLESEENLLESYGWVDRGTGTVRIPIERAMDVLVQRGVPTRPHASPPSPNRGGAVGESNSGRTVGVVKP
ncbi:MAG: hypothetical protein HYX76_01100 [Acidobacteria bacterium]|nr:hypothetical protein [Acidobacteriota bacterium]